jgi:hypothetical protein
VRSWGKVAVLVLLAISVSACGVTEKPKTALELVDLMESELAKVESYTTDINTKVNYVTKSHPDGYGDEMTFRQKTDKINDLLTVFIDMNMKMSTIKEEITRARYFVNEQLYDFVDGEWAKRTEPEVEEFKQLMDKEKSLLSSKIKNYSLNEKDIHMSQDGENYIIKINLLLSDDGNQTSDLKPETIQKMKDENTKKFATVLTINSRTLLPVKHTIDYIVEEKRYGSIEDRVSNSETIFSNYNKVKKIILPKEAELAEVKPYF